MYNNLREKMKNKFLFIYLILILISPIYSSNRLKNTISKKQWNELPPIFSDNSYTILEDYFDKVEHIKFISHASNKITYRAKFLKYGEVGVIIFNKKDKKFLNLSIINQIKPIYFINNFKKYHVNNLSLKVGDAKIHFEEGYIYESIPFNLLMIFSGNWEFSIKPNDEEEKLTLKNEYKKDFFSKSNNRGIFILEDKSFLSKTTQLGKVTRLDKKSQSLFEIYRDTYGKKIKQFKEYWYLPFSEGSNLIIFPKEKKTFYYYKFKRDSVPDTQLTILTDNNMILSYNSVKSLKLSFSGVNEVDKVKLNIFYNPINNFISGTIITLYKDPTSLKILQLKKNLKLVGNLDKKAVGLNVFKKGPLYFLLGPETNKSALYYKGYIKPDNLYDDIFKMQYQETENIETLDLFYYLSRTENFYPNPGNEFFKSDVTINLPNNLNCLISGSLIKKIAVNRNIFKYTSKGTKGISVICGNFSLKDRIDSIIPINIYSSKFCRYSKYINKSEIKKIVNFLIQKYGDINISEINILFKNDLHEGGVSNRGFIIINLSPKRSDVLNIKFRHSPITFRDNVGDYIIHEISHQWWGGIISWKSYRDVWITEGLAQFSVLYYLRNNISDKNFKRIIKKIKKLLYKHNNSGPVIYGTRIIKLENNYEAYQTIVYNKSALIFLMLFDMIGEKDFLNRLHSILNKFKFKSISSMQFINQFINKDKTLLKFFKKWVYSRKLPEIIYNIKIDEKSAEISIEQLNTDFVFPITFNVKSSKGISFEKVIVKQKTEKFIIKRDSSIKSINIIDPIGPIKISRR